MIGPEKAQPSAGLSFAAKIMAKYGYKVNDFDIYILNILIEAQRGPELKSPGKKKTREIKGINFTKKFYSNGKYRNKKSVKLIHFI